MYKLNQQQKNFVQKYRETGNATQSYIDAGYKARGNAARASASKLLTNPNVQAYLTELNEKSESDAIAKADEVLKYLTSVMRGETRETIVMLAQKTGELVSCKKPPDETTKIRAATEILKRYPVDGISTDQNIKIIFDGIKDG